MGLRFLSIIFYFTLISFDVFSQDSSFYTKVEVKYFHATIRCQSCLTVEKYTKETLEYFFANEMENKTLSFSTFDFQANDNIDLVEKFSIDSQELIICLVRYGKVVEWKKLDRIWDNLNNFEKFSRYIKEEVEQFLTKAKHFDK